MFSMISLVSATVVRDMKVEEMLVKKPNLLTIVSNFWFLSGGANEESCLSWMQDACLYHKWDLTDAGYPGEGGWASLMKNCYWDGSICKCDAYMNDEPLFTTYCGGAKAINPVCYTMNEVIEDGACVRCTYGQEQCQGLELFECHGCQYISQGYVQGKCGYAPVCEEGTYHCGSNIFTSTPPYQGGSYIDNHWYRCLRYTSGIHTGDTVWFDTGLETGKCGVECVYDYNCGSGEICKDNLCKPSFVCTTGDKKCVEDNVVYCSNNQWEVQKTCPYTQRCEEGICVSIATPPTQPEISSLAKFFQGIWDWIKGFFGG